MSGIRTKYLTFKPGRKKPDHFYFQRVFDPYIRKEFDVLRSADVTNLPANIREILQSRYEFVVAERDVIGDLTDNLRLCETCEKWAPSPDDLIFPKAATRVGARYQAVVGPWVAPDTNASPQPSQIPDGVPERGGDDTIEMMSVIVSMSEEEQAAFNTFHQNLWSKPAARNGVDFLEESARRYSLQYLDITQKFNSTTRPRKVLAAKDTRFWDKDWTQDEIEQFENGIKQHGPEMRAIKDGIKTRSIYEVRPPKGRESTIENQYFNRQKHFVEAKSLTSSDDESSVYGFGGDVPRQVCGACRSKESAVWWKAPRGLPTEVMCDQCGISWRKYGDIRSGRIEEPKKSNGIDKRENTPQPPVKRTKVSMSRGPSPHLHPDSIYVVCCKKSGPVGRVVQCTQCGVQVHAGEAFMVPAEHDSLTRHPVAPAVYGVTEEDAMAEIWLCELCQNEKSQESSLNPNCLLCPRTSNDNLQSKQSAVASTILRLSKPTEGRGWVHTLCSVFVPETSFTDATRLRLVEGISSVSDARWASACSVCRQEGGAVVSCASGCGTQFHVSCAWMAGHAFGFEIRQSKNIRRDPATIVEFRGEVGVMKASIRCKTHSASLRPSFDICSLNTNGESHFSFTAEHINRFPSHILMGSCEKQNDWTPCSRSGFPTCNLIHWRPIKSSELGQQLQVLRSGPLSRGLAGVPEAVTDIGSEDIRLEKIAAAHATPVQAR
ncbi:PHD-zinc-finger like domain [Rhizoctonia solani]|uniref:PHD-zinc-finger like domain n=1 Tax=Rhizoctonia solani TaxID=456999 RepID=A0A8H7IGT9_9AGAM|nr:PHD-zinc-finger like domain [Rhizoctonia solani]